jgi:peptidoglycan hydrolase-like protein with peptidoglycan-binding domain
MTDVTRALNWKRPAMWVVTAALLLVAPAPALAKEGPSGGSLAQGVGFSEPSGSDRVKAVQRQLNRLGYRAGDVDGLFGPITESAVRRFQQATGLGVDGIVGPQTRQALKARTAGYLGRGAGYSKAAGSDRVRGMQRSLNRLGYRAGRVDGLFGPITESAVRRFQQASGLNVDGIVGPRTTASLRPAAAAARLDAKGARNRRHQEGSRGSRSEARDRSGQADRPTREESATEDWWLVLLAVVAFVGALLLVAVTLGVLSWGGRARARPEQAAEEAEWPTPVPNEQAVLRGMADRGGHVWRAQLVDVPFVARLLGVGARVHLVPGSGLTARSNRAYVELSLFAEGIRGRWETEILDQGAPFVVDVDDLEGSVRGIVMPDRLEVLARTLRRHGVELEAQDLDVLPFMLELSPELEHELVERRIGRVSTIAD